MSFKTIKEEKLLAYQRGYEAGLKIKYGRTPNERLRKFKEKWKKDVLELIDELKGKCPECTSGGLHAEELKARIKG